MNSKEINSQLPLGRNLAILTKNYYGALRKRLEHLEIDKHYSVLVFISQSKQKCTQQFISDNLKIDKTSMVSIVDYFVKKNFLKRIVNPEDRREHLIELTKKAEKVLPELFFEISKLNEEALAGLSLKEKETFEKAVCSICTNLSKMPSTRILIKIKN